MAKNTKKKIKQLSKAVEKLQEQNEQLSERLTRALEDQAQEIREVRAATALERVDSDGSSRAEALEVTEAAERRAAELDVNLSEVDGTGAQGRILVKDVEEATGAKE
ncbi:hypothetical protein BH23ACT11_BH23ACT11_20850 [soil metagenome]